jgi:hypothetical protein
LIGLYNNKIRISLRRCKHPNLKKKANLNLNKVILRSGLDLWNRLTRLAESTWKKWRPTQTKLD